MIYIGADHRGYELKEKIKKFLGKLGLDFEDLGASELNPEDDFNEFAEKVSAKVSANPNEDRGVLICRTGVGVDIVANKFKDIRSVLGFDAEQVRLARNDEDVNLLSLPADFVSEQEVEEIIKQFLNTNFENSEKRLRRINKIKDLEKW